MKILLVEDDVLLSTALTESLTGNGYSIDIASNGQTGLELAISTEYELILLDWLIPKLDGISLCRQLRSQGYSKSILLLTEELQQQGLHEAHKLAGSMGSFGYPEGSEFREKQENFKF